MMTPIFIRQNYRLLLYLILSICTLSSVSANRVIIDADTGNEMDDLYAIFRGLMEPELELIAITSAHFNNPQLLTDEYWHIYPTKDIDPVGISQELNEKLISGVGSMIPAIKGCDQMVGYAWGYYNGAPIPNSPAVDFIIQEAEKTPLNEKLDVIILGPVTNVAAAILKSPQIAQKIRCYVLGMRYDFEKEAWNKNTFNTRNDPSGTDILLDCDELELIVIPGNISRNLVFEREKSIQLLQGDDPVISLLNKRWDEVDAGDSWIMWDLALVEYVIDSSVGTMIEVDTPPENSPRKIKLINSIDAKEIERRFWESIEDYRSKKG